MLLELYTQEKNMYNDMLAKTYETHEQRIHRLKQKAKDLKDKKEKERKQYAQTKLEEAWRLSVDELRLADSRLRQLETLAALDLQCFEKIKQTQTLQEEDKMFDWLMCEEWKRYDCEEEKKKQDRLVKLIAARKAIDQMVQEQQAEKAAIIALKKQEDFEIRKKTAEFNAVCRYAQERHRQSMYERRKELDEYVKKQSQISHHKKLQESKADIEYIANILAFEAEELRAEQVQKEKLKEAYYHHRKCLEVAMAEEIESDDIIEALHNQAAEEQWQKREAEWQRESETREKLRLETIQGWQQQLEEKEKMRKEIVAEKLSDKSAVQNAIAEYEAEQIAKAKSALAYMQELKESREAQLYERMAQRREDQKALQQEHRREAEELHQTFEAVKLQERHQAEMKSQIMANRQQQQESHRRILEQQNTHARAQTQNKTQHRSLAPWER